MEHVHERCRYDPCTRLGELEPIVLFQRQENGQAVGFHITKGAYAALNGGCGECYGRTPWGPFCRLQIYQYRVISSRVIHDAELLRQIREEIFT